MANSSNEVDTTGTLYSLQTERCCDGGPVGILEKCPEEATCATGGFTGCCAHNVTGQYIQCANDSAECPAGTVFVPPGDCIY